MKPFVNSVGGVLLFLLFVAGALFWFEAEKEIRILCSMFRPGQPVEAVTRTLDTGAFLEYRVVTMQGREAIFVDAPYTLGTSRCQVLLSEGDTVQSARYRQSFRLEKAAAWLGTTMLSALVVFQLLLAVGRPLGRWAWGGRYETLPVALRIASTASAVVLAAGAVVLLEEARIIRLLQAPGPTGYGVWVLAGLFGLSAIGNRLSASKPERSVMAPIALLLCGLCIIVGMAD